MKGSPHVDREVMARVAQSARIFLTDEESESLIAECNEILEAFALLEEVDVKEVDPSFHPLELRQTLREDERGESLSQKDALLNVRHKKNGYIRGPSVR